MCGWIISISFILVNRSAMGDQPEAEIETPWERLARMSYFTRRIGAVKSSHD